MKRLWLGIVALVACTHAWGIEADLTLQQLNHKGWTLADGAPGAIYAIAQTTDGTLWVAGPSGLSRFDGIRFVRYDGSLDLPIERTGIRTLAASPDGSLWMGFVFGGVGVLKAEGFVHYADADGLPSGTVNGIVFDRAGIAYAGTSRGLYRLRGNRWEPVPLVSGEQSAHVWAVNVDAAGTLWIVTDSHVLARGASERNFKKITPRKSERRISPNTLASGPDGQMWALNLNQMGAVARVGALGDAREKTLPEVMFADTTANPGIAFDRSGNLWIGGSAVRRLAAATLSGDPATAAKLMETFDLSDGLTGGSVNCFFEDREGNMWVGTYSGLDRFSPSNVVRVSSTNTFGAAVAGDDGAVYVSTVETGPGARYPLLEIHDNTIVKKMPGPHFTSAYRAPDGSIWFGGRDGLRQFGSGQFGPTIELPARDSVNSMVQDRSGALWVAVSSRGLYRYADGDWTSESKGPGQVRGAPLTAGVDSDGRILFGYRDNQIVRIDGSALERFGQSEGLDVGNVTAIAASKQDVWIGGDRGVAHFDGARFTSVVSAAENLFTGVSGIVATENGDLWLNGNAGIVHLTRAEWERAMKDRAYRVQFEMFDRLDGLRGYARQVRPSPSAFEGTDGRIWFATQVGLVGIDPSRIVRNALPPPVTIWSVNDRSVQYPTVALTNLPMDTTNLRIEYTAGSLTIAERVRFRYKLDGVDRDWQDVGDRREATYTNLSPGRYLFRVIASNNDGVWNNDGASLAFTIAPAFHQTKAFYGLCALAALAFLWLLYTVRIRQVSAQVRSRLEERLAERERIARELHDTLLQSVQGLVLRFRAAVSRLPEAEPAKAAMEGALERADGVLNEGRDRVKQLRSSVGGELDLPQAIAAWGEELATEHEVHFRPTVEGVVRELHPIVREEVMYIAREALTNAFLHAKAKQIEAEISYKESELQIRIRDDGCGIDGDVLSAGGREGHWGLLGMRERAKKIRATLTLWSKPDAGTEIEVRLPAHIAYQSRNPVRRQESLASWL